MTQTKTSGAGRQLPGIPADPVNTQEGTRVSAHIVEEITSAAQIQPPVDVAAILAELEASAAAAAALPTPDCPPWCTLPPRHEYTTATQADEPSRWHTRCILDMPRLGIEVNQRERVTAAGTVLDRVEISLVGEHDGTPAELRRIAAGCSAAAKFVEALPGGAV